jgi:hypothetical protein
MFDIEKYMESFKESITKRLEGNEENFNNLVNKVKSIEETQNQYKKRLRRLEDCRNQSENEDIELQKVKYRKYSIDIPGGIHFFSTLNITKIFLNLLS